VNEELGAFREEVRNAFAEIRHQFADVHRRFADVHQQFTDVHQQFTDVHQQFADVRQQFADVHRRIDAVDERVRHQGVLLEAVRDDVRLVAEAQVSLGERVDRHRQDNDAAHQEILALLRSSYRELDGRVSRLEAQREQG
jgi:chromosome segregation ATPase